MLFQAKDERIIIAAASGRWLARSCLRAQVPVSVIDLFCDQDTREICEKTNDFCHHSMSAAETSRCDSFLKIWSTLANQIEAAPGKTKIILGGGMENIPPDMPDDLWRLLEQIPNVQRFDELQQIETLARFGNNFQINIPASLAERTPISSLNKSNSSASQTIWLSKRSDSSGGLGVQYAGPSHTSDTPGLSGYLQQHIHGRSVSGCFVGTRLKEGSIEKGSITSSLLGICEAWPHGHEPSLQLEQSRPFPFRYTGSWGPLRVSEHIEPAIVQKMKRIGQATVERFGLVGVFGIDFILANDQLWLLEINPRPPASAELIERAARENNREFTIAMVHLNAIDGISFDGTAPGNRLYGKRIIYAEPTWPTINFSQNLQKQLEAVLKHARAELNLCTMPLITDIPVSNSRIDPDWPILTVHVSADTHVKLCRALQIIEHSFKEIFQNEIG